MKHIIFIFTFLVLIFGLVAQTPFQHASAAGVSLSYRVTQDSQNLECIISATTTGWLSVGFEVTTGMLNSNLIMGYNQGGVTHARDDWGTSPGTHASDVSLGGVDNVMNASSTEVGGVTTFNFTIPLNSGDAFDHVLVIGQTYNISLGFGVNGGNDFQSAMANFGLTTVTIVAPVVSNGDNTLPVVPLIDNITVAPNPCVTNTSISFDLKTAAPVRMDIYNAKGQLVRSFGMVNYPSGTNNVVWNGLDTNNQRLSSGIYYTRILLHNRQYTHKFMLIK